MTALHDRLLWHALGLSHHCGTTEPHRNHYVTGPAAGPILDLVRGGLMEECDLRSWMEASSRLFVVTAAGREHALRTFHEAAPKLTRSQRRYRRYLNEDSSLTFGEWLKTAAGRGR